jgi:hypothetical protein
MPVRKAYYHIYSYGNGTEREEILFFFEILWINGNFTPKEALHEASRKLID